MAKTSFFLFLSPMKSTGKNGGVSLHTKFTFKFHLNSSAFSSSYFALVEHVVEVELLGVGIALWIEEFSSLTTAFNSQVHIRVGTCNALALEEDEEAKPLTHTFQSEYNIRP